MQIIRVSAVLLALSSLTLPVAAIDCNKATTPTETTICGDPKLVAKDKAVNLAFSWTLKNANQKQRAMLKNSQLHWVAGGRDVCRTNSKCLAASMAGRIEFLEPRAHYGTNPGTAMVARANSHVNPAQPKFGQSNEAIVYLKPKREFEKAWNNLAKNVLATEEVPDEQGWGGATLKMTYGSKSLI